MKKKLILGLLVVVTLFTLTGCGSKTNSVDNQPANQDTSDLKIGNVVVDLNQSSKINNMTYKYPMDAMASNLGTYAIMDLMNGEDLLVRVAISFYERKTIDEVLNGSNLSKKEDLKYNNNTWSIYKGTNTDGKNLLNYLTEDNSTIYSITFISDKDIDSFIDEFMKNIVFN